MNALKNIDYKDVAIRALWTFLQAFLATVLVGLEQVIDTLFTGDFRGAWVLTLALVLGGISAGLSALKTVVVEFIRELRARA